MTRRTTLITPSTAANDFGLQLDGVRSAESALAEYRRHLNRQLTGTRTALDDLNAGRVTITVQEGVFGRTLRDVPLPPEVTG